MTMKKMKRVMIYPASMSSLSSKFQISIPTDQNDFCFQFWIWSFEICYLACLRDLPAPAGARASRRREPLRRRQGFGIWDLGFQIFSTP